jgi:7-cyano-7-deazaguanine synthase
MKPAVVLLSGGVDSTTTLAIALRDCFDVHALTFRYGQRHAHEIELTKKIAAKYGVSHHICEIDLRAIGGSALTSDIAVPKHRDQTEMANGIPITYVPARNTIFLSFALAWAEVLGTQDIFIGANIVDYSGYPDCRPEYFRAFERMANLATKAGVEGTSNFTIHTPLINLRKSAIIALGLHLGVDYGLTSSCYEPVDGAACGACDSCTIRSNGFADINVIDPIPYRVPCTA